jgi:UDP-N-acetylmuramate dehydrogenase
VRNALGDLLADRVRFDEPTARYTSLRVGGPADAMARPRSRDQLAALLALCERHGLPWVVLGNGFNTLVRDEGLRGLAIRLADLRALSRTDEGSVYAEAGVTHTTLTRFCADEGLAGLEFGVGIPGTVGGWLIMNAGIPDREMKDVAERVDYLDSAGALHEKPAEALEWSYRRLQLPPASVVVGGRFATRPDDSRAIRARMREHLDHRRETQPVNEPSCGSVFKNPEGDRAGRLIEAAGLKGTRIGGAAISELHANFIVNRGGASAGDVLELIERARDQVLAQFGVRLETEVQVLGEEAQ